jgi:hypothetical protein
LGFILLGVGYILLVVLLVFGYHWKLRSFAKMPIRSLKGKVQVVRRFNPITDGIGLPVFANRLIIRNDSNPWFTHVFEFNDKTSLDYFETGRFYRVFYLDKQHALSAEEIKPEKAKSTRI